MNEHEAERIAAAMHQLRPDWPAASLRTILKNPKLANRPRRDVAVALAWVACEANTATPVRVLESGPWWKAASVEGSVTLTPPKFEDICHTCQRESCVCPGGRTVRPPVRGDTAVGAAACREALRKESA